MLMKAFVGRKGPANVCFEVRNGQDVMFSTLKRQTGSDRLVLFIFCDP